MSAARYNLVIDQGSDFAVNFTVKDNGSAKDLTGYSARAQMRTTKSASSVAATFTCSIPTPANGTVVMSLPNATSSAMAAGAAVSASPKGFNAMNSRPATAMACCASPPPKRRATLL